jgi:hypothetical protein
MPAAGARKEPRGFTARERASREDAMEQILIAAICLLAGIAALALTHRPPRPVTMQSRRWRDDQVARP